MPVVGEEKSEDKEILIRNMRHRSTFSSTGKAFEEEMAEALKEETPQASGISGLIDTLALPSKEETWRS